MIANPKKRSKYRNKKTEVDGITFDSAKEAKRWKELQLLERAKKISGLKRQHKFPLWVNGVEIGSYVADFVYMDVEKGYATRFVVEDVKSEITREIPLYKWKKALMKAVHSIEIVEV